MRELTAHQVNQANKQLRVTAVDAAGQGGAHHLYEIGWFNVTDNPSKPDYWPDTGATLCVLFQNGPIAEAGVNGITHEALLAILIDRLEGFQSGKFASPHNAQALAYLRQALGALHDRTRERQARSVEGTHAP